LQYIDNKYKELRLQYLRSNDVEKLVGYEGKKHGTFDGEAYYQNSITEFNTMLNKALHAGTYFNIS